MVFREVLRPRRRIFVVQVSNPTGHALERHETRARGFEQ